MNKSDLSFFEYYPQYRIDKENLPDGKNFDWKRYNADWSRQSMMLSHGMTSATTKDGYYYRRGFNIHGLKAKEIKKFMTEWIGVDRLRGGSNVKRLKNQDEVNLQPHRRNKINRKLKLTSLMDSLLYVDDDLKKKKDMGKKNPHHHHRKFPLNWLEGSMNRYGGQVKEDGGWHKDKRYGIKFHDITSNIHSEIINFLDKITTPVNYHRIFLMPSAFQGLNGIKSMYANKGKANLPSGHGEGMLFIIPEGFCIPWCSYKDLITEHGVGWRKFRFTPPWYNFTYSKGWGQINYSSSQHAAGFGYMHRGGFSAFLKQIIKLFNQYSLYPGDEPADAKLFQGFKVGDWVLDKFKKNDLLNPLNQDRWNHPQKIKHIYNVGFMSERFIKSLSHKPFKEFIPQEYDNFYTEIKINDTFNTINYLKGIPIEDKKP